MPRYLVRVDETRLRTRAAAWWTDWRLAQGARCAVVGVSLGGALVDIACGSQGHAVDVVVMLEDAGLPKCALSVRKGE